MIYEITETKNDVCMTINELKKKLEEGWVFKVEVNGAYVVEKVVKYLEDV